MIKLLNLEKAQKKKKENNPKRTQKKTQKIRKKIAPTKVLQTIRN